MIKNGTLDQKGFMNVLSGKQLLGVEFTEEHLKIALIKLSGDKKEVSRLEAIPIKDIPEDRVIELLKASLNEMKVSNKNVVFILPVSFAITKTIQIPSTNESEIRDILNLQAGRQTPYSREELVIDHVTLGQFQGVYTKVLVVMVTIELIKQKLDMLTLAGLSVSKILFAGDGIAAFCSDISKAEASISTGAMVTIEENSSDFNVFGADGLLFTRNIPVGAKHLNQDKVKALPKIVTEIRRSIDTYQSEEISDPLSIIHIEKRSEYGQEIIDGLSAHLKIKIKDFDLNNYLAVAKPFDRLLIDTQTPSFLPLISSTCKNEILRVDLTPDDIKLQHKFAEKAKKITMAGALIMVIFFQVCLIYITEMYYQERHLNKIKARYADKISEADNLRVMSEKTSIIRNYITENDSVLRIVSLLYEMLPDEIYLKGVNIDKEGKIFIKGTSESMSRVFSFVTELENTDLFASVKTEYTESRKEKGQDVSDFGVVMVLEGKEIEEEDKQEKEQE